MTDSSQPSLPMQLDSNVAVRAKVDGGDVLSSGCLVVRNTQKITLSIFDLMYDFSFKDDGGEHRLETEERTDKRIKFVLHNFSNALGTSFGPVEIGQISGKQIYLSLFVESIGKNVRATSYTIYLGEESGE